MWIKRFTYIAELVNKIFHKSLKLLAIFEPRKMLTIPLHNNNTNRLVAYAFLSHHKVVNFRGGTLNSK